MLQGSTVKMAIIFLVVFAVEVQWFSYIPLIPPVKDTFALSYTQSGFLMSLMSIAFLAISLPAGFLQDRSDAVPFFPIGLAFSVLGTGLRVLAEDFTGFIVAHAILGAGVGVVWVSMPRIIAQWFPARKRGVPTALYIMAWPLGAAFAFAFTPALFEALGSLYGVFIFHTLWTFVIVVLWLGLSRLQKGIYMEAGPSGSSRLSQMRMVLGSRLIWTLSILYMCVTGIFAGVSTWLPTILVERGVALSLSGAIVAIFPIGFAAGALIIGKAAERFSKPAPLIYYTGALAAPAVIGSFFLDGVPLGLAALLLGISVSFIPLLFIISMERKHLSRNVAGAAGVISSVGSLGSMVMATAVGAIRDITGGFTGALFPLLALALTVPILGLAIKEKPRSGQKATDRS